MRMLLTMLALVVAACSQDQGIQGRSEKPDPGTVRIRVAAWNLEHFGKRKVEPRWSPNGPRTAADIAQIAAFIQAEGFDLLALAEINGVAPLKRLAGKLGARWRFVIGETGDLGREQIGVGFLWNSARVQLVEAAEMRDLPSQVPDAAERSGKLSILHRKPANAVFRVVRDGRDTLDFRLIAVHLKASRGERNERKRRAEVQQLRTYIESLQADPQQDQDIIVLGDFNHSYGAPAYQSFTAGDLVHYLRGDGSPTIVHFDDPIDHIAVTKGIREEVVPGSFRVHNTAVPYGKAEAAVVDAAKRSWRKVYSDHFPVSVELDASRDRDPEANFRPGLHKLQVHSAPAAEDQR